MSLQKLTLEEVSKQGTSFSKVTALATETNNQSPEGRAWVCLRPLQSELETIQKPDAMYKLPSRKLKLNLDQLKDAMVRSLSHVGRSFVRRLSSEQ